MNSHTPKRVLLVDDHKLILDGLKLLLHPKGCVFFEASNLAEARRIGAEEKPDLAIIDYRLGGESGDVLVRDLRYHSPHTRILGHSYTSDHAAVMSLIEAGVHGFIQKSDRPDQLLEAVDTVLAGGVYFDELSRNLLITRITENRVEEQGCQVGDVNFSAKELQLIRLMIREMSAREMAKEMFLSERTIEQYKFRIARKMGVKNMVGIIRYAIKHGMLKADDL